METARNQKKFKPQLKYPIWGTNIFRGDICEVE